MRDLVERETFDVPQHPSHAIGGRDARERGLEQHELRALIRRCTCGREIGDAGVVAPDAQEAKDTLAAKHAMHLAHRDAEHPAAERARLAERAQIGERGDEGVLRDVFGLGALSEQAHDRAEHARRVSPEERLFSPTVSVEGPPHQVFIPNLAPADGLDHGDVGLGLSGGSGHPDEESLGALETAQRVSRRGDLGVLAAMKALTTFLLMTGCGVDVNVLDGVDGSVDSGGGPDAGRDGAIGVDGPPVLSPECPASRALPEPRPAAGTRCGWDDAVTGESCYYHRGTGARLDRPDACAFRADCIDGVAQHVETAACEESYYRLVPATVDFRVSPEMCDSYEGVGKRFTVTHHWFSSCHEPGPIQIDLDETARTVTILGWNWEIVGPTDCRSVGSAVGRYAFVDGLTNGTWTVTWAGGSVEMLVGGAPPPITCIDPRPIGASCLADCDCIEGRCVDAGNDAVCAERTCQQVCNTWLRLPPFTPESLDAPLLHSECRPGYECVSDARFGHSCRDPGRDLCDGADCPVGTRCVTDSDLTSYCDWDLALSASVRHPCNANSECDPGLDCVVPIEGPAPKEYRGTCEVRCRTTEQGCPAMHACSNRGSPLNRDWVCEWLGE